MKIKETIVVEGRDDTAAILRAVDAYTIETHGFGIKSSTLKLIQKAYEHQGIIIFTDPDYMGEQIRKRLNQKFPKAKQAYLKREDALAGDNVGIENASPESIIEALGKAKAISIENCSIFSIKDLQQAGLVGLPDSKQKRQKLGKILGVGYANGNGLLKKLNGFGVTREQFEEALKQI